MAACPLPPGSAPDSHARTEEGRVTNGAPPSARQHGNYRCQGPPQSQMTSRGIVLDAGNRTFPLFDSLFVGNALTGGLQMEAGCCERRQVHDWDLTLATRGKDQDGAHSCELLILRYVASQTSEGGHGMEDDPTGNATSNESAENPPPELLVLLARFMGLCVLSFVLAIFTDSSSFPGTVGVAIAYLVAPAILLFFAALICLMVRKRFTWKEVTKTYLIAWVLVNGLSMLGLVVRLLNS